MINTFEELKDWAMYEAKISTQLAMNVHTEFCETPTREKARKFWAVQGELVDVAWGDIFGITETGK